jgi:hypothetical protein
MSGTITIPAAKLGAHEEKIGRSAHQHTSLYFPPLLSFCSQNTHSDILTNYMCFGLAGRGQIGLEGENFKYHHPHHPQDFYPWPQYKLPVVWEGSFTNNSHIS